MFRGSTSLSLVGASFILCSCALFSGCGVKLPARPEGVPIKQIEFSPPKIEEWSEANGLKVMLLTNPDLPLVEGALYLPYGSLQERIPGSLDALMSGVRSGGVKGLSPIEVDRSLDALGASIEGSAGREFSSLSFFSHKDDFGTVFGLLSKMVTTPSFNEARLNLWKARALDGISRRREDPETIATLTFSRVMYGEHSPYSSLITPATVRQIKSSALQRLASGVLNPEGALLTVSGQITRAELHSALEQMLSHWHGGKQVDLSPLPTPKYVGKPGIYVVESNFDQAAVFMGEPGPARQSSDQYALSVFNRYFSRGEFGAVLFSEIRSKRGYAYSVDGGFAPGAKGGEYILSLGTRTSEVSNAVHEVLNQIARSHQETATPERLAEIRRSVAQGFVFNFATPEGALAREATLRLLNYPKDYNETYIARISSVSQGDLLELSQKRLDPSKFIIVVVGKVSANELSRRFGSSYPIRSVRFDTEPRLSNK